MTHNEQSLKRELSLRQPKPLYLLYGDEPALLAAYRRRVAELAGGEAEKISGGELDVSALWDASQLLPMLSGRRVLLVEDLEPETLSDADCKDLCALFPEIPETTTLILCARAGSLDAKKGSRSKKLLAAAEASGVVACLNRRSSADLKSWLRTRCEKARCELSAADAAFLLERCGDDMGILSGECEKLCAYAGAGGAITREMIRTVCAPSPEGDLYALSRLLLRGDANAILSEIDLLLRQRQPAALLLANLGAAMTDLYRAAVARAAGHSAEEMAKELHFRFEWRAKNAFRDSARLEPQRLHAVCRILFDAEFALKSGGAVDERVLLESAVIRCLSALRGDAL